VRLLSLWTPVVLYMAFIFYVNGLSQPPVDPGRFDKLLHFTGYVPLGITLVRALAGGLPARVRWTTAAAAIAIGVVYGATDEFHQTFVPNRSADVKDLYADAIGVALGTMLCWAWGILSAVPSDFGRPRHEL
jgi:VanZ family protein